MAELVCRASDPGWLDARRAGVTATDIVTLAGLASWDSPFALYWRKKGRLPEVEQTPRMRLGLWLEDEIAHDSAVYHIDHRLGSGGLYRSSDRPWQLATPDRLVLDLPYDSTEPLAVLEVKTASSRAGWGDDGTDQVPGRVRAQVLWQMDVMGVDRGYVAVCFLPSGEIRSYTIDPDPEYIKELQAIGGGFWQLFNADVPPPVDGLPATTEALKDLHGWEPKTSAEIEPDLAHSYATACHTRDLYDDMARTFSNEIRNAMGDAQLATLDGEVIARREVYKRREYTVAAGVVDRLVRVKPKETGDA